MGGGESNKRSIRCIVHLVVAATTYYLQTSAREEPQVPCFFIFGDSNSDSGNNNKLPTLAKANFAPYGIDFPGGVATGRFTNKFNSVDYIAKFMGKALIPPFANTSGSNILKGVNYASSAAGILPDTALNVGPHYNLPAQIEQHKVIYASIASKLGSVKAAEKYLHKCFYHITIGGVDYFSKYRIDPSFNVTQFTNYLIYQYAQQIKVLYKLGARKFALIGIASPGCVPIIRNTSGECVQVLNEGGYLFNEKLKSLVGNFNSKYSGMASFIFVNSSAISSQNPNFSALNQKDACCKIDASGVCIRNEKPCENRDEYLYWDGYHNADIANKLYALSQYNSSDPNFAYPMDISHLLAA